MKMVLKESGLRTVAVFDCDCCGVRVDICRWCGKVFTCSDRLKIFCGSDGHYHKDCGREVKELDTEDIDVCVSFIKGVYPNCDLSGYNEDAVRRAFREAKWMQKYGKKGGC